ncbi:hypothetical protein ACIA48_30055 [Mycobacterium sp. NPDC051804]|uniref:hypothetical protein n=1 Tax=Mycobacterium sp. NPDC051804 TaxID=3364295 RepID=UPI0037A37B28
MTVRIRPASKRRTINGDVRPDNWLTAVDHALFVGQRATDWKPVMQVVWVYEHPVDFDGLRRFHRNLGHGLLGRLIERSPLPFARSQWVLDRGPSDVDIAEHARPRSEVSDWADERTQVLVDPELGPGWHLGVLPLTDGSTAISLVISHHVADGLGLVVALVDAAHDNQRDLGYAPPRSRSRLGAVAQDAGRTARDAPAVARALVAAAQQARRSRQDAAQSPASRPIAVRGGNSDHQVVIPAVTICVGLDEWDARAQALGGTSKTLVAGLVAKFAELIGRRRAGDGAVTLRLPISTRADGDDRANAVSYMAVTVDPTPVTTDLTEVRAAINQALRTLRDTPDESLELASLTPFIPKRALKRMNNAAVADPEMPVFCSNLGDFGTVVCRLDGTDAEYVTGRLTTQHATRDYFERIGGMMTVQSWRLPDHIVINIGSYQPGAENTKPRLRELAWRLLTEFGLSGEVE